MSALGLGIGVSFPGSSVGSAATPYSTMKAAAMTAATNNSASLWFLGNAADLVGNVFTDAAGTIQAGAGSQVGYLKDRNGNTYPMTQTTGSSSPAVLLLASGYYALNLNGSQFLNSARIFTQAMNHTVIGVAAGIVGTSNSTIFGVGNSSNFDRFPQLRLRGGNTPSAQYVSDAGTPEVVGSIVSTSLPPPISVVRTGTNAVLWVKNVNVGNVATPSGANVMLVSAIGVFPASGEGLTGQIALVCAAPVAMSNADRQAIEAFGALLTGTTYP